MARSNAVTLAQIADWHNLLEAAGRAARGATAKACVVRFFDQLDKELVSLQRDILSESVEVGQATRFLIYYPKPRLIFAPVFRERVLQHALMAHVGPELNRSLVADTFACRVGKGTIAAVRRAQHHSRRLGWYGQIDIRRYFASIDHEVLLDSLNRRFRDRGVRELLRRIVTSHADQPGRGLPIGALCSQHFANFYLSPLDRAVMEQSPATAMVRYMDDLVLWANGQADVQCAIARATGVVREKLHLELRESAIVNRSEHGLSFCGFRIFPGILRALPRRKRRFIETRRRWERRYADGRISGLQLQRGYDAAAGILAAVDSQAWRRRQLQVSPPQLADDDL